jgi:hypothetical protein
MKNRDIVDIGNTNSLGMVLYQIDASDVSIGIRGAQDLEAEMERCAGTAGRIGIGIGRDFGG